MAAGPRAASSRFIAAAALLVLLKFWLIQTEEIIGSATEFDALWFVNSATHWYWGTPYSWTAFMRPPSYPLWLAFVQALGLRQRIAIELLQLGGFAALALALRRGGVRPAVCLIVLASLMFHPATFQMNDYTMADTFYAAILPFVVAGMIWTMTQYSLGAAIRTGVAIGVLWNTREESALLVLLIMVFAATWFVWTRAAGTAPRRVLKPLACMIGAALVVVLTLYGLNYRTFHSFAKSEMSERRFEAAFKALMRIAPADARRFVPITTESLRLAAEASPTFARLKPQLDGVVGQFWRIDSSLSPNGVPGEILLNLMIWAVRDAAGRTGVHGDPLKAQHFYGKVAREINAACDEGKIPSRRVLGVFLDPSVLRNMVYFPQSLGRVLKLFVLPHEVAVPKDDEVLTPPQRAIYDEVTHRRALHPDAGSSLSLRVERWIGAAHPTVVMFLLCGGLVAAAAIIIRVRSLQLSDPLYPTICIIAAAVLIRILFFAFMDAVAWKCDFERFLYPVLPLSSALLILLMYAAAKE